MKTNLTAALCLGVLLGGAYAFAQFCVVPAPALPPTAIQVVINLPGDGGTTGCTAYAITTTGKTNPNVYPIGNAKCAAAAAFGLQAVANDNGWTDGGTPQ